MRVDVHYLRVWIRHHELFGGIPEAMSIDWEGDSQQASEAVCRESAPYITDYLAVEYILPRLELGRF